MRVLYVFTMNKCKVSDAQIVRFVALSLSVEQILYGYSVSYFCTVSAFRIQTVAAENHSFGLCP